jgi:hypothetical protein
MRNENELIWEAFDISLNESRRTPEETERLQRNIERYRHLMSAQEQGESDYFDWSEFEDYSDYEDEIEALEKEAEANGYLDQLERYADFDADSERNATRLYNDPLRQKAYQVKRNRFKKDGKLNKQDTDTMKKRLKEPWDDRYNTSHSVKGMKKPNLPKEDAEGEFDGPGMQWDGIDDDSSKGVSRIDANTNFITKMISARAVECVESIDTIYDLVEDRGSEMLDNQAAEKLEDIIEHASNALRELNLRLD